MPVATVVIADVADVAGAEAALDWAVCGALRLLTPLAKSALSFWSAVAVSDREPVEPSEAGAAAVLAPSDPAGWLAAVLLLSGPSIGILLTGELPSASDCLESIDALEAETPAGALSDNTSGAERGVDVWERVNSNAGMLGSAVAGAGFLAAAEVAESIRLVKAADASPDAESAETVSADGFESSMSIDGRPLVALDTRPSGPLVARSAVIKAESASAGPGSAELVTAGPSTVELSNKSERELSTAVGFTSFAIRVGANMRPDEAVLRAPAVVVGLAERGCVSTETMLVCPESTTVCPAAPSDRSLMPTGTAGELAGEMTAAAGPVAAVEARGTLLGRSALLLVVPGVGSEETILDEGANFGTGANFMGRALSIPTRPAVPGVELFEAATDFGARDVCCLWSLAGSV